MPFARTIISALTLAFAGFIAWQMPEHALWLLEQSEQGLDQLGQGLEGHIALLWRFVASEVAAALLLLTLAVGLMVRLCSWCSSWVVMTAATLPIIANAIKIALDQIGLADPLIQASRLVSDSLPRQVRSSLNSFGLEQHLQVLLVLVALITIMAICGITSRMMQRKIEVSPEC